jgi:hypothetical protein
MPEFSDLANTAKYDPDHLDPRAVRSALLRAVEIEDALQCLTRCGTLSVARKGEETELSFALRLDSETADALLVVLLDLGGFTPLIEREES